MLKTARQRALARKAWIRARDADAALSSLVRGAAAHQPPRTNQELLVAARESLREAAASLDKIDAGGTRDVAD